jgi:hypothetical protein
MFHELFAFGPPWRSSFWVAPVQVMIAARFARISETLLTNRQRSARFLRACAPAVSISVVPVLSNFGEPEQPPPLAARLPQAVFFGGLGRTIKNLSAGWAVIENSCRALGIQKVVLAGRDLARPPGGTSLQVEVLGPLSAESASRLLMASRAGFLDYFDGYLGKSSFFAAYCAHGLLPILFTPNDSGEDGVREGHHFLVGSAIPAACSLQTQQKIAGAALQWYSSHNLRSTVDIFAAALDLRALAPCQ